MTLSLMILLAVVAVAIAVVPAVVIVVQDARRAAGTATVTPLGRATGARHSVAA